MIVCFYIFKEKLGFIMKGEILIIVSIIFVIFICYIKIEYVFYFESFIDIYFRLVNIVRL